MLTHEILAFVQSAGRPITANDLVRGLSLQRRDITLLQTTLRELVRQGQLVRTKEGKYRAPNKQTSVRGVLRTHARGFGYVTDESGREFYVPQGHLGDAANGDTVLVRPIEGGDRAKIEEVLVPGTRAATGLLQRYEGDAFWVQPDDAHLGFSIIIDNGRENGAQVGQQVAVTFAPPITTHADGHRTCKGQVARVLGEADDPTTRMLSVAYAAGLPVDYPASVQDAAKQMPIAVTSEEVQDRVDYRNQTVFTIDGADAQDLDDAVSITPLPQGGYQVFVHIADVSHYVQKGSVIDNEAYKRGTSCYLPGLTLHMLPTALSQGICSLHPEVDRLVLTCELHFDAAGNRTHCSLHRGVIKTTARLTYDDVNALVMDNAKPSEAAQALAEPLTAMNTLAKQLAARRKLAGGLDFDLAESQIVLNDKSEVTDVFPRPRGDGERLIENMMLAANEGVAHTLAAQGYPVLFRIHEEPAQQKLDDFLHTAKLLGAITKGKHLTPAGVPQMLERLRGNKAQTVLEKLLLRSLPKARYSPQNFGHFGLASHEYCHFTSPIRRYPDLTIHRLIKDLLSEEKPAWQNELKDIGIATSNAERRAMDAERTALDIRRAEWLSHHLGEAFTGTVVDVTGFGAFVALPNTCEGLVRLENLPGDRYDFDPKRQQLNAGSSGRVIAMGQRMQIVVAGADLATGQADFLPA